MTRQRSAARFLVIKDAYCHRSRPAAPGPKSGGTINRTAVNREPSEKQGPIQCGRPAQADMRTDARRGPQSPGLAANTPAQAVPHCLHRPSGDRVHWSIA